MRTHPAGSAHTQYPHQWQTMCHWVLIPWCVKSSCVPFVSQRSSNSSFLFLRKLFSHEDVVSCFYCALILFFLLSLCSSKFFCKVTYAHLGLNVKTKQQLCDDRFHMFTRITGRDYSSPNIGAQSRSLVIPR